MNPNLTKIAIGIIYAALAVVFSRKLMMGGFISVLQAATIVSPLVIILTLNYRKYLVGLILGIFTINVQSRIPLLDALGLSTVFIGLVWVLWVGHQAIRSGDSTRGNSPYVGWMRVLAGLMIVRLALDPPGSARMGEVGGLNQALQYLMAVVCAFFAARGVVEFMENPKRQVAIIFLLACVGFLRVLSRQDTESFYFGIYFHKHMWVIMSVLLAWSLYRRPARPTPSRLFWILALVTLILSLVSPHRSRPIFAVGMIMAVALAHRIHRKAFVFISLMAFVGIGGVLAVRGELPGIVQRSLSTIISPSRQDIRGETGIESAFREGLYREGWSKIRNHPIIGKGWAFDRQEILELLMTRRQRESTAGMLAGSYHNAILAIAVFNGLPAALFAILVLIATYIKFIDWIRRAPEGDYAFLGTVLLCMAVPFTGQMLMNGAGPDFMYTCTVLGLMTGLMENHSFVKRKTAGSSALPGRGTLSLAPSPIPAGLPP